MMVAVDADLVRFFSGNRLPAPNPKPLNPKSSGWFDERWQVMAVERGPDP